MVVEHPYDIFQIDADYMQQAGMACCYLLRQGDRLAVIETGTSYTATFVLRQIAKLGLTPGHVDWIIPTHVHLDHAGGAGTLMAQCPNAMLAVHPRGARHLIDPAKLIAGTIAVYGAAKFQTMYGDVTPIAAERVLETSDGMSLDFNGRELLILDTPGHAKHHNCIFDSTSRGIFTGDTFGIAYPNTLRHDHQPLLFATTTPVQFDPDDLHRSIDRIGACGAHTAYLTHFGAVAITAISVAQLHHSVETLVEIARDNIGIANDDARIASMTAEILEYIVADIATADTQRARQWLATDAQLNAQGLDVWLQTQHT